MERLQKILARGGVASRRSAEELIKAGRVRVNGRTVTELGAKADPRSDRIEVDGKRVVAEQPVYVVLHKPRGVVATMSDPEGRPTVRELLTGLDARVYPVGRLDFATSGVLLATNDGGFADGLLHPRRAVPKTYVVKVKGKMEVADLDRWRKGVELEDGKTLPAEAKMIRYEGDKTWFELTIREGRNQQIRRMGEATGFPVMRLARVAFAEIDAEGLRPGQWRYLRREELVLLKKEYGVPRSIPASPSETASPGQRKKPAHGGGQAVRGRTAAGRGTRGPGAAGGGAERGDRAERGRPSQGGERRDRAGRGRPSQGAAPRTEGARYGGGSPGRRSYEVTDDWGGGAGRSAAVDRFDRDADRPRDDLGGGRGSRTRTTGTGGGVGARSDAGRVKGRRG